MTGATISHSVADDTVPASERAFYSFTSSSVVKSRHTELHDYRSSSDVLHGPEGLDAQGFTYVERDFSLNSMELLEGHNIEDIYFREVEDLVLKATGAKRVLGLEAVVRCQKTIAKEELKSRQAKGGERDSAFDGQDREAPLVVGRSGTDKQGAAPVAHIDWSIKGLRAAVRSYRTDLRYMALDAIRAEAKGETPRYAAFSIWRPLKTVRRDPLAVCDYRTIDMETEACQVDFRATSPFGEGEYLQSGYLVPKPSEDTRQKWYYMSGQKPNEVLILKLADTGSENDPSISNGVAHVAAVLDGSEDIEEPRQSIEVRVVAFW